MKFILLGLIVTGMSFAKVGDIAADATLDTFQVDGTIVSKSILTKNPGTDFVYLDFFSFHCDACMLSLPILNDLQKELQDVLTFRAVNMDKRADAINELQTHPESISFDMSFDGTKVFRKYGGTLIPLGVVVDGNGKVVYHKIGEPSKADLDKIRQIVGK